jgi:hypothetical protein
MVKVNKCDIFYTGFPESWDGRMVRQINIIDDFNCQVIWIDTDHRLSALRFIRMLKQLRGSRGLPKDDSGRKRLGIY